MSQISLPHDLTCRGCGQRFSKKDLFSNRGQVVDDESCICCGCLENPPVKTRKNRSRFWILLLVILILSVVFLTPWYLFISIRQKQERKALEDAVHCKITMLGADYQIALKKIDTKYSQAKEVVDQQLNELNQNKPDTKAIDAFEKQIQDHQFLTTKQLKLQKNRAKEIVDTTIQYTVSVAEEMKKLNPDKAEEIDRRIKELTQFGSGSELDSFKKVLRELQQDKENSLKTWKGIDETKRDFDQL